MALALHYSLLGRYMYAIGSNEATARLCGINVPFIKVIVYSMGGLAMGLAGVLQFAYLGCDRRPDNGRRTRASGHRRGRDRRRKLERRRGDRHGYSDRLPDHAGAQKRLCPCGYSQPKPRHHHRHHHRRGRDPRPATSHQGFVIGRAAATVSVAPATKLTYRPGRLPADAPK